MNGVREGHGVMQLNVTTVAGRVSDWSAPRDSFTTPAQPMRSPRQWVVERSACYASALQNH